MTNLRRFDPITKRSEAFMVESENGGYVLSTDHDAAIAALEAELKEARADVEHSQHVRANLHAIKTLEAALFQSQNAAIDLAKSNAALKSQLASLRKSLDSKGEALRAIAVGLLPEDRVAGDDKMYMLCASRLCGIARAAIATEVKL